MSVRWLSSRTSAAVNASLPAARPAGVGDVINHEMPADRAVGAVAVAEDSEASGKVLYLPAERRPMTTR